jgi:hypothetical protein
MGPYQKLAQKIVSMKGVNNNRAWKPYYQKGVATRHFFNDVTRNKRF